VARLFYERGQTRVVDASDQYGISISIVPITSGAVLVLDTIQKLTTYC
jgi:hypothetical protein